jgi:hypothetical protein
MSGWRSNYLPASTQLRLQHPALLALVGRRLKVGWTGWNPKTQRWFPDIPLVLEFDDSVRLELQWKTWDHLSITWNTIDVTVAPEVAGRPFEWRASAPEPVAAIAGRVLTGFAVTETPYFTGDIDFTNGLPDKAPAGWQVSGLWIAFGGVGLHVYNGQDANGLASTPSQPVYEGPGYDRVVRACNGAEANAHPAEPSDPRYEAAQRVTYWPPPTQGKALPPLPA